MSLSYHRYLHTRELLNLQHPLSPEPDEHLFIVSHQVCELWFKQILRELEQWAQSLQESAYTHARAAMQRVLDMLKLTIAQIELLERIGPVAFSRFRPYLQGASGSSSAQFREIEAWLGFDDAPLCAQLGSDSPEHAKIQARRQSKHLWCHFVAYAQREGFALALDPKDESQDKALLELYQRHPQATRLAEQLLELDQSIQLWRFRHLQMAQRNIGTKRGSGGTTGVSFLQNRLQKTAFPALWRVASLT